MKRLRLLFLFTILSIFLCSTAYGQGSIFGLSTFENNDILIGTGHNQLGTIQKSALGYVVGPSSVVDSDLACFDTTTGKLLKDCGLKFPSGTEGAVYYYHSGNIGSLVVGTVNSIFGVGTNGAPGYPFLLNPSATLGSSTSTVPSEGVVSTALSGKQNTLGANDFLKPDGSVPITGGYLDFGIISVPSAPTGAKYRLYANPDTYLYYLDSNSASTKLAKFSDLSGYLNDASIFPLLAGRAGGQTIYGSSIGNISFTRTDISFVDTDNTVHTVAGNFVTAGFLPGRSITITAWNNYGNHTIVSVDSPTQMTLSGSISAEESGHTITLFFGQDLQLYSNPSKDPQIS